MLQVAPDCVLTSSAAPCSPFSVLYRATSGTADTEPTSPNQWNAERTRSCDQLQRLAKVCRTGLPRSHCRRRRGRGCVWVRKLQAGGYVTLTPLPNSVHGLVVLSEAYGRRVFKGVSECMDKDV